MEAGGADAAGIVGQGQQDSTSVTYTCGGEVFRRDILALPIFPSVVHSNLILYLLPDQTGCGAKNWVKPQDQIRCRACGYRILYKMRTKRMVQHEAR